MPVSFFLEEICRLAITNYGKALEFVPLKYKTKELFFTAVKQNREALKFVDVNLLTNDEYTQICNIAFWGV